MSTEYNAICATLREQLNAYGTILIVFQGKYGHGVSVQAPQELVKVLPAYFRDLANAMEEEMVASEQVEVSV